MADMYLKLYEECTKERKTLDAEVKKVTDDASLQIFLDKVKRLEGKYNKLKRMERNIL